MLTVEQKLFLVEVARNIVKEAYGRFNLEPDCQITINTNKRMIATAGKAYYRQNRIDLSFPFFYKVYETEPDKAHQQFKDTVIHEACHLISYKLYGDNGKGHGWAWKSCMKKCGCEPKRCHSYNFTQTNELFCGCGLHKVGNVRYKRWEKGTKYLCTKCRKYLTNKPI